MHEQGLTIDSIEANVETATHQVSEGARQLSKASGYQVNLFFPFSLYLLSLLNFLT